MLSGVVSCALVLVVVYPCIYTHCTSPSTKHHPPIITPPSSPPHHHPIIITPSSSPHHYSTPIIITPPPFIITHSPPHLYPPPLSGANVTVKNAILDLDCSIGDGSTLVNAQGIQESTKLQGMGIIIRDGLVVVNKGAVVPPGTHV